MSDASFPAWPVFEADECEAALRVLHSGRVNYWTGGECRGFEADWTRLTDCPYTLTMANGSVTLEAALRALGIGPGHDVLVSPRSYVASAMCVLNVGARPVFADVCPESGNVSAATLEAARTPATRAAIPVHLGGWPCDMAPMMQWADAHNVAILEDCAQAHGARDGTRPLGTFGHAASWSFCQDKIMTTGGEGGMLAMRSRDAWKQVWSMTQHGKDFDLAGAPAGTEAFRWLVRHTGTNLRLTEMQAAIGRVQLRKLPAWLDARRRNAQILHDAFAALPFLRVPAAPEGHAWYRFYAYARPEMGVSRDALISAVTRAGWPCYVGSCPEIYREPLFEERGLAPSQPLRVARELGETSIAFLVHHTIAPAAMRAYAQGAAAAMEAACLAGARSGSRA